MPYLRTHYMCLLIMNLDGRTHSKKTKKKQKKEENLSTRQRYATTIFNSNTQAVLQCSKVKQDVRMLLATASSFLDGDDGVLMMTTMTTSTRKTARTHTVQYNTNVAVYVHACMDA